MWCSRCGGECRGHQDFHFTATEPATMRSDAPPAAVADPPPAWRQEVSRRVRGFHSRRRPRTNRNRSIGFDFEAAAKPAPSEGATVVAIPEPPPRTDLAFLRSLNAHENATHSGAIREQLKALQSTSEITEVEEQFDGSTLARLTETVLHLETKTSENNLIEFPRPPEPALDLAEPVIETPRIFEAEDVAAVQREEQQLAVAVAAPPPVPSIMLEPPLTSTAAPLELELPLPVAPLELRVIAGALDAASAAAITCLFWFVASLAGFPQGRAAVATLALAGLGIWGLYQYLFLTRMGRTPGMSYIGLRIGRVQPKPLTRTLLAARAVSVLLSSAAAGMGFLWALVEEDRLTWHDRMTQTFVSAR
jgi:uncharacterized RDD family membrane protein YckC